MINCENFNSFTLIGILDKINIFIKNNHIKKCNIICLSRCRDGSIDLYYWDI